MCLKLGTSLPLNRQLITLLLLHRAVKVSLSCPTPMPLKGTLTCLITKNVTALSSFFADHYL